MLIIKYIKQGWGQGCLLAGYVVYVKNTGPSNSVCKEMTQDSLAVHYYIAECLGIRGKHVTISLPLLHNKISISVVAFTPIVYSPGSIPV